MASEREAWREGHCPVSPSELACFVAVAACWGVGRVGLWVWQVEEGRFGWVIGKGAEAYTLEEQRCEAGMSCGRAWSVCRDGAIQAESVEAGKCG